MDELLRSGRGERGVESGDIFEVEKSCFGQRFDKGVESTMTQRFLYF